MWNAIAIICAACILVGGAQKINANNNETKIKQTGYEVCAGLVPVDRIACVKEVR